MKIREILPWLWMGIMVIMFLPIPIMFVYAIWAMFFDLIISKFL